MRFLFSMKGFIGEWEAEALMGKLFDYKLNTIKWIGIVTMTIDHIGFFLFPEITLLRIIGRIAFPCFLYSTIEGTERTKNYKQYILRLLLLGLVSIPVTPNSLNVLFLLLLFSLSLKYKQYAFLYALLSFFVEYSIYGFIFGWALYWLKKRSVAQGIFFSFTVQFIMGFSIQFFSLLALPLFISPIEWKLPRLPRYSFYFFYPLHQLVLLFIASLI